MKKFKYLLHLIVSIVLGTLGILVIVLLLAALTLNMFMFIIDEQKGNMALTKILEYTDKILKTLGDWSEN